MITNYLSPLEFEVSVKRLPNIEFFVQKTSIPSITATAPEMASPMNRIYQTPDKLTYGDFSLSFIVDEKMENYLEIFNWMVSLTAPQEYGQYKKLRDSEDGLISDISILLKNSHKNPNLVISYKNCFPISLDAVELDTTQQDVTYPEATVTFQYDFFTISYANT